MTQLTIARNLVLLFFYYSSSCTQMLHALRQAKFLWFYPLYRSMHWHWHGMRILRQFGKSFSQKKKKNLLCDTNQHMCWAIKFNVETPKCEIFTLHDGTTHTYTHTFCIPHSLFPSFSDYFLFFLEQQQKKIFFGCAKKKLMSTDINTRQVYICTHMCGTKKHRMHLIALFLNDLFLSLFLPNV